MNSYLLYMYAESPVHAGAPDSTSGIDLPIQRESATNYPVVWGQSLKGALRRVFSEHPDADKEVVTELFGSDPPGSGGASSASTASRENEAAAKNTTMGSVAVSDAQLVALPVPTLQRTFAWITSELALGRLARRYRRLPGDGTVPTVPRLRQGAAAAGTAWVPQQGAAPQEVLGPCLVSVEDEASDPAAAWATRIRDDAFGAPPEESMAYFAQKLTEDFLVVNDSAMSVLLRECMEHSVRIQLDADTKTVNHGPFTSEYLPTDTVLAATLTVRTGSDLDGEYLDTVLNGATWQLGGDESIGKGLVWSRLVRGDA